MPDATHLPEDSARDSVEENHDEDDDFWLEEPEAASPEGLQLSGQAADPQLTVGLVVTDFATIDVLVDGIDDTGGLGLVLWGPCQHRLGQSIALKILHLRYQEDIELRQAYEAEAIAWCHVWPHRNIVTTNGLTRLPSLQGQPALVLNYAAGGTLRKRLDIAHSLQEAPLPLSRAFGWAQQIAAALAHMHTADPGHERPQPLIHADVKPENILLDAEDVALLSDLSLARAWRSAAPENPEELHREHIQQVDQASFSAESINLDRQPDELASATQDEGSADQTKCKGLS